jgi:hypothetical protein
MNAKLSFLLAVLCGGVSAGPALAAENPINPEADRLLRQCSSKLSAAKELSFKAEVWEDNVVAGHKVSTSKTVAVQLRRPNGVQIEVQSPTRSRGFWYDGHSLTVLDRVNNLYAVIQVPDNINKVLDTASDKYGIHLPLEDLLANDFYSYTMEKTKGGAYFGKVNVLGTPCHHIAFSTDVIDWQLWIADDTSLPRKLVITYKKEQAQPQVTSIFTEWNLNTRFSDDTFVFSAPHGANKIEMLPGKPMDPNAE